MRVTYKHINLNENDEAQYAFFYPLTNRLKDVSDHTESFKIDESEMEEFNKYWKPVEEENSTSKLVEQYSESNRLIIKDDAQKLVTPFPHLQLTMLNTKERYGKPIKTELKLNVRQAQILRDILDAFIKRNT